MSVQRDGGCQCGAVRYRVTQEPLGVRVCHCKECQRQSGGAFSLSMLVRDEAFSVLQGTVKSFTRSSDSGRSVTGSFCPECGTRIFHRAELYRGYTNVRAGTLDDTSWIKPTASIWMKSKQAWVRMQDDLDHVELQS